MTNDSNTYKDRWKHAMQSMLGRHGHNLQESSLPQVLPSLLFREELEREMLLCDRTELPLTLLLFDIVDRGGARVSSPSEIRRLAEIICQSTRRSDLKGWFRDARGLHLGVMMTNTAYEKIDRIISCIREKYSPPDSDYLAACEIYAYPGHSGRLDESFEQLHLFDDESLIDVGSSERPMERTAIRPIDELLVAPFPAWKRAMDITASLLALIVLSPFLLVIALAIKITSPGPVIFKQERVGHLGKHFLLWKFRSMRDKANPSAHRKYLKRLISSHSDAKDAPMTKLDSVNPEITGMGRILRMTCLDELPQLVNVLMGEMSLIGPRPCLPYEADQYLQWHYRRFDTMPGITGLWQVSGKNKTTFRQMIRLDIYYSCHCSFWLDMQIILMTLPAVIAEFRGEMKAKTSSVRGRPQPVAEMDRA